MRRQKVVMLGSFGVGKTSLVRRFVEQAFDDKYLSTVGVKISRKTIALQPAAVTLLLWDVAGREGFEHMRKSYLRGAAGALIVCDVTRPETWAGLRAELETFLEERPGKPFVLAANKVDLLPDPETLPPEVEALGSLGSVHSTSALDGRGVEAAFAELAQKVCA